MTTPKLGKRLHLADFCLMHRSIMVCYRKAPLNGKNRPEAVIADFEPL